MAIIADRLSFIAWTKTKDAEKGRNRPDSILAAMYKNDDKPTGYNTATDYEEARRKILESISNGGRN